MAQKVSPDCKGGKFILFPAPKKYLFVNVKQ